jgi:membrane protease YdiL (CAAX protease family)
MPRCPNCGRKTFRTEDWACRWCGYPLLSRAYKKIPKTYKQFQEERLYALGLKKPEPELEPKPEPKAIRLRRVTPGAIKLPLLYVFYLLAFIIVEFVTHYVNVSSGIILNFTILLMLIINSVVVSEEAHRKFMLALGLAPLIRILSLAVPMAEISEIYWYIIIAIPVFASIVTVTRNVNYSFDDIGFNGRKPLIQVLIAIVGMGLGIIDYTILKPEGLISELTVQTIVLPALILLIATGFVEELAFRGVMQRAARVLGSWGLVYIAIIYAVLQTGHGSVGHSVFAFIVALFFGWVVKKTGSIVGVSLSHGLLNIVLYLILPHVGSYMIIPSLF